MSALGISAVNVSEEPYVVASGWLLNSATDEATKPFPAKEMLILPDPARADMGFIEISAGTGFTPVPLIAMDCGELPALSVMVIVAVSAPVVTGARCPWMVQLAPAATVAPHVFAKTNDDAFAPVTEMLETLRSAIPSFVSVTICDPLAAPTASVPKARLAVESDTAGAAIPVPLNEIVCGELLALSMMVIVAVSVPVVVGAKWPWMVQFAPVVRLVPHVLPNTNEDALLPLTAILVIDNAALSVLVNVTDCVALDAPTPSLPKERLPAERVTGALGGVPVPLNAIVCGELVALSVMVTDAVRAPPAVGAKCP